ncbi:hypothetical protein SCAR479_01653 [Seiridium cardinale]|uniref:2EXR domain-containing protein n=1 Tax=Seiridium cardinale TaxID=138064 RepID=A0ABR2Y635_9PEZI
MSPSPASSLCRYNQTSNSMTTTHPLDEYTPLRHFHAFGKLPPEIRVAIWDWALATDLCCRHVEREGSSLNFTRSPLLVVNYECRARAQAVYNVFITVHESVPPEESQQAHADNTENPEKRYLGIMYLSLDWNLDLPSGFSDCQKTVLGFKLAAVRESLLKNALKMTGRPRNFVYTLKHLVAVGPSYMGFKAFVVHDCGIVFHWKPL